MPQESHPPSLLAKDLQKEGLFARLQKIVGRQEGREGLLTSIGSLGP